MNRPLVVLVEDDSDTAALYSTVLSAEGMEVVRFPNCAQAQQWWAKPPRRPDMLIVDVGLPDGDGLDLCAELNATDNGWPPPPMLILSAHGDPRLATRCKKAGAQGFLDKLEGIDLFVAKVKELIAA